MNKYLIYLLLSLAALSCATPKSTEVTTITATTKSWNGTRLPSYPAGNPEVTILHITIPPKTRLKTHLHPVINAGVVLKGALTVVSEHQDTLHLKKGDSIVELVNQWHYGENESRHKPVELIVFYAGLKDQPFTIVKQP